MRFGWARATSLLAIILAAGLSPATDVTAQALPPLANAAAQVAQRDLAVRNDVAPEAISILEVHPVTFRDTSLGCPRPDQLYAQALRPGFQVIMGWNGEIWDYRVDSTTRPMFCGNVYTGWIAQTIPGEWTVIIGNEADGRAIPLWVQYWTRVHFADGVAARWDDLTPGAYVYVIGNWDEYNWLVPQEIAVLG